MAAVEENSAKMNKRKIQENPINEIDEPAQKKFNMEEVVSNVNILNLDSYMLLNIFQYCNAADLKALAFTCTRFAALVVDRSLWYTVDATSKPHGSIRLQWYMDNCLHKGTRKLHVTGHALRDTKCCGLSLTSRATQERTSKRAGCTYKGSNRLVGHEDPNWQRVFRDLFHLTNPTTKAVYWPLSADRTSRYHKSLEGDECTGPVFTLSRPLLVQLRHRCSLTELKLEYCNIDYPANPIAFFPPKLKILSLRGTRCFNSRTRSYICGIHEYLPLLEELDVSSCDWLEPAALLPLSKLSCLQKLSIVQCLKFSECVAYAALATRNGFKSLRILDARQSPLSDSEVSSFGWVFTLEELYLESAPTRPEMPQHLHYPDDPVTTSSELEEWETSEAANYFDIENTEKLQSESHGDVSKSACLGRIFTSTLKRNAHNYDMTRNASGSADEVLPPKKRRAEVDVNEGASTSKDALAENTLWGSDAEAEDEDANGEPGPSIRSVGRPPADQPMGQIIIASLSGGSRPPTRWHHLLTEDDDDSPIRNGCEPPKRNGGRRAVSNEDGDDGESTSSSDNEEADAPQPRGNAMPRPRGNAVPQLRGNVVQFRRNRSPQQRRENVIQILRNQQQPWAGAGANGPGLGNGNGAVVVQVNPIGNLRRLRSINNLVCPSICLRQKEPAETSLVTDSALYKFGSSDNIVGYVDIGVRVPQFDTMRPEKTRLRVLVCRGYRTVTDRVLRHFVTAAPELRHLDLRGTSVTKKGAESFQNLRPECEVLSGY